MKMRLFMAAALVVAIGPTAQAANAPSAFNICKACHKTTAGGRGIGPSLFGVVGRKAGTLAGYNYSAAMKAAGFTWTPDMLSKYIADPKGTVPDNKMPFAGLKDPAKVKQVVEYLETLK